MGNLEILKTRTTFAVRNSSKNEDLQHKCFKKTASEGMQVPSISYASHRTVTQRLASFFNSNKLLMRNSNAKRGKSTKKQNYKADVISIQIAKSKIPSHLTDVVDAEIWAKIDELEVLTVQRLTRPKAKLHAMLNLNSIRAEFMFYEYGIDRLGWS